MEEHRSLDLFQKVKILSEDRTHASVSDSMLCRLYCSRFGGRAALLPSFLLQSSFERPAVSYPTITRHLTPCADRGCVLISLSSAFSSQFFRHV